MLSSPSKTSNCSCPKDPSRLRWKDHSLLFSRTTSIEDNKYNGSATQIKFCSIAAKLPKIRLTFKESWEESLKNLSPKSTCKSLSAGRKLKIQNYRKCSSRVSLICLRLKKELLDERRCKAFLTDLMLRKKSARVWRITSTRQSVSSKANFAFTLQLAKSKRKTSLHRVIALCLCPRRHNKKAKISPATEEKISSII